MPVFKKTQTTYPVFYLIVCTALQVVLAALFSKTRAQVPEPHVPIAMQWHFDGDRRVSTEGGVDWVFSILPNDKNQYLVSGYTSTDRIIRPGYSYYLNTVPSLFKLDNLGRILWSKEITSVSSHGMTYDGQSYGGLYQIIKTSSGYAAIGFVTTTTAGDASLLVEYDDAGTIINQALLQPTYMGGATPCHTYSIALDPSGNNYIIAGDAGAGTYWNAFVAKVSRSTMSITASYFAGNSSGDNLFEKVLVQATGGGNYNIYASGYKSMSGDNTNVSGTNNSGNTVTLTKHNKDIWLLSLSSNFSTVLHNATYNKTTLNYPSSLYYTEAGLLTARTMATANLSPVMTANLRADAGHDVNNDERGYDMILSQDGKIIILALINGIYVRGPYGGTNGHYIFRNDPSNGGVKGVVDPNRPSGSNYYDDYMDGDGYILKIDPSSSYNVSYTKNVGHFGSKDCHPRIIQEANGRLVIGGSTTDYGMGVNYYDAYMLATGDNSTAGHYWRRACHAHSEDAMCFFALAATADGGIIIGGDRTVNQNTEDDNFSVTKFAPECASTFGKSNYHLFGQQLDIATNTTWSAGTRYIASKIVIRPGAKLTINNSTIKFAASDHMWDYCDFGLRNSDGRQIGIVVDPGGELEINNSTLKGMDACGRMMWDGIVIQGNTGTSAKGILRLNNSTIADARIGVMVAEAYRATLTQHAPTSSTFSPNIDAYTYSTRYNSYGWFGGGTVFASGSTFKNCRFSVNYQNNPTPGTTSGYFGGNTFICDSNMADPCMYIYPDGSPMPSDNFFAAWNVNKVNFEDNTFTIDTKYPFDHRPMGILLSDAGARIQASCSALDAAGNCIGTLGSGNSFSNLKYGVNAIYTPAKSGLQLVISQNTFNNNGRGTAIFNSSSPSVNRNTFKVPGNTGSFPYPMGVQIEGAR
ncbi:MAG: hypothetical protein JNL13_03175, partial [Chitinophagaceae bacterium]|nr:hypothetical protein [Chitinophagaceae bacterium]